MLRPGSPSGRRMAFVTAPDLFLWLVRQTAPIQWCSLAPREGGFSEEDMSQHPPCCGWFDWIDSPQGFLSSGQVRNLRQEGAPKNPPTCVVWHLHPFVYPITKILRSRAWRSKAWTTVVRGRDRAAAWSRPRPAPTDPLPGSCQAVLDAMVDPTSMDIWISTRGSASIWFSKTSDAFLRRGEPCRPQRNRADAHSAA